MLKIQPKRRGQDGVFLPPSLPSFLLSPTFQPPMNDALCTRTVTQGEEWKEGGREGGREEGRAVGVGGGGVSDGEGLESCFEARLEGGREGDEEEGGACCCMRSVIVVVVALKD
jgi:hypothetical protein